MLALLLLSCYLIGSIPVGWIVTKASTGEDLRRMGSGNVGVMNVARCVSRWAGVVVFLGEAAKGMASVAIARAWDGSALALGLATVAVVAGTRWPIWLRGQGGRGNTAGAAALLTVSWPALAVFPLLWFPARMICKNHFIATRAAYLTWPFTLLLIDPSGWLTIPWGAVCVIYLTNQRRATDDHLLINQEWGSFGSFLTAKPRKVKTMRPSALYRPLHLEGRDNGWTHQL